MLGEFEYLMISAASRLGEDAYGSAIRHEIEEATGRRCSIGALYTTLPTIARLMNSRRVFTVLSLSLPVAAQG